MPLEIRPAGREEMEDFGHAAFTSLVLSPEVMPREVIRESGPNGRFAHSKTESSLPLMLHGLSPCSSAKQPLP